MKRLYEFITRANQVLLFLGILSLAGFVAFMTCCDRSGHRDVSVPVAQTPEEVRKIKVEDVRFLGKEADYYVFGVHKQLVGARGPDRGEAAMKASISSWSSSSDGELVNVVFTREGQVVRSLLPSDGLVFSRSLAYHRAGDDEFRFHRFRCVTEDTNADRVLDAKDRQDLYIVPTDLKQTVIVIKGATDSDVLSPTVLLVKVVDPTGIHFFEVDCETRTQTEIAWK